MDDIETVTQNLLKIANFLSIEEYKKNGIETLESLLQQIATDNDEKIFKKVAESEFRTKVRFDKQAKVI